MESNKVLYWWEMLEEELRLEIFRNNNPDDITDDWSDWWTRLDINEKEEIYLENIEDTNNEGVNENV